MTHGSLQQCLISDILLLHIYDESRLFVGGNSIQCNMAGAGFVYLWWLHVWFHNGDSIPIKRVRRVSNRVGRSCVIFRSPVVKIASPSNIQTQFLSHDLTTIILTFHFRSKFIEQYIFNILLHTISGGGLNYFAPLSPRESMIVHQQKDWIVKTC